MYRYNLLSRSNDKHFMKSIFHGGCSKITLTYKRSYFFA